MESNAFWTELHERVAKYDLLCHPYYKSWSAGSLTREDLREYAANYYHHVAAFPTYLAAFYARLEDGAFRRTVLANLADEEAIEGGRPHSEMWLDFAEGMGADRDAARASQAIPEIQALISHFRGVAQNGSPEEALAAFYAYESQVPRVAKEKARGLQEMYGADRRPLATSRCIPPPTCITRTSGASSCQNVWKRIQKWPSELSHPPKLPRRLSGLPSTASKPSGNASCCLKNEIHHRGREYAEQHSVNLCAFCGEISRSVPDNHALQ